MNTILSARSALTLVTTRAFSALLVGATFTTACSTEGHSLGNDAPLTGEGTGGATNDAVDGAPSGTQSSGGAPSGYDGGGTGGAGTASGGASDLPLFADGGTCPTVDVNGVAYASSAFSEPAGYPCSSGQVGVPQPTTCSSTQFFARWSCNPIDPAYEPSVPGFVVRTVGCGFDVARTTTSVTLNGTPGGEEYFFDLSTGKFVGDIEVFPDEVRKASRCPDLKRIVWGRTTSCATPTATYLCTSRPPSGAPDGGTP